MFKKIIHMSWLSSFSSQPCSCCVPHPPKRSSWPPMTCARSHLGRWRLAVQAMPANSVASDALTDTKQASGKRSSSTGPGRYLAYSNLGELITLQPDERAVAVKVTDTTGLVGLLVPGQKIGIVASVPVQSNTTQGTFSKATIEGLRVLYLDPRFAATDATSMQQPAAPVPWWEPPAASAQPPSVPSRVLLYWQSDSLQTVVYDFSAANAVSESRSVNVLEMLAALDSTSGAEISLYLMPGRKCQTILFARPVVAGPGGHSPGHPIATPPLRSNPNWRP